MHGHDCSIKKNTLTAVLYAQEKKPMKIMTKVKVVK